MKQNPVLVVDLDGCYLRNDFFAERLIKKAIENPVYLFMHFVIRRRGWLDLKKKLLADIQITYPLVQLINVPVQEFIYENRRSYSGVVLVSASPDEFVKRLLAGNEVFDEVHGSESTNLKAEEKLAFIRARYGNNFHYIGNSKDDEVILDAAIKGFKVMRNTLHERN